MSVQYINGQLYNVWEPSMAGVNTVGNYAINKGVGAGYANPIGAPSQGQPSTQNNNSSNIYNNPFGTASSGNMTGTLQPYVNRMTQNASNALYGGLLNYSPQSVVAGDAGGTPVNSNVPQFNLPSAIAQGAGGLLGGFGNRSWMTK